MREEELKQLILCGLEAFYKKTGELEVVEIEGLEQLREVLKANVPTKVIQQALDYVVEHIILKEDQSVADEKFVECYEKIMQNVARLRV